MRRRIRGTWHEGDEKSNESERQSRVGEEIIDARADFLQIRDSSLEPRVIPYRGSPITKHRAEDFARRSRATGLSGSDVAARVRWRSTRPTRSPDVKDEGTAPKKVVKSHKMGMKATPSPYMMKVKLFHEKNGYEGDAFTLHDESQTLSFMKKKAANRSSRPLQTLKILNLGRVAKGRCRSSRRGNSTKGPSSRYVENPKHVTKC
mgnify:CR=1 FL=1